MKKQIVCFYDSLVTNCQITRRHILFTTVMNSSLLYAVVLCHSAAVCVDKYKTITFRLNIEMCNTAA